MRIERETCGADEAPSSPAALGLSRTRRGRLSKLDMGPGSSIASASSMLYALIVAAPLVAGGWRLEAVLGIAGLAALAWLALLYQRRRDGRSVSIPALALALGGLAAFTAGQAAPLGEGLALLSPRAADVRAFVAPEGRMTVTYEVGATWREALKMLTYGLVAAVAHEVARRRGARRVLVPVTVAGLASVVVALAHRPFQLDALFGFLEVARPLQKLTTTFQNPNHASAFLTMTALVAIGLGVDATGRARRLGYFGAAAGLAGVSVVEPSKGGVLALLVGLVLFAFLLYRKKGNEAVERLDASLLFAALLLPLAGLVFQLEAVVAEFGYGEQAMPLGLAEKLAAVQNALPVIRDHLWAGIGRGAYVSVYPHYQTSPLQLTFAFPENVAAQLVSEWGLIVGGAALLGLVWAVALRLARAHRPQEMGAAAALASVLVHDLVDFSLEMPGMAVAFAATAGALSPRRKTARADGSDRSGLRLDLHGGGAAALGLGPGVLAGLFAYGALRGGDLQRDLAWLEQHGLAAAQGRSIDHEEVRRRSSRHPANVLVTTQLAYLKEIERDIPGALATVNRALFLGPRYADAHVLAGRLLLRGGHRRQAFEELRAAWRLTSGRSDILAAAHHWASAPEELLLAVPRSDPVLGTLDVRALARLAIYLFAVGDSSSARAVLSAVPPVETISAEMLEPLAQAALAVGLTDLALAAGRRGAELRPDDAVLELTLATLAYRAGRLDDAARLADRIDPKQVNPDELFELRLRLALDRKDYPGAHAVLEALRRHLPVTREVQTDLAMREARVHLEEGRPDRAVTVLGRAVDWSPGEIEVRMLRAHALARLGRRREAQIDLEFVLRRDPSHGPAKNLMERLRISN